MQYQKIKGNLMLLLTAVVWGLSFIAQSKGVETVPAVAFIAIRSILGGLVLLPFIGITDYAKRRRGESVQKTDKNLLAGGVVCGALLCLATALQTFGMETTSPGKAGFITALYMVIVPVIGLFMGKKPGRFVAVSVLVAVVGLYLMCIEPGAVSLGGGDLLVLACAFVFAGHILAIDYFVPKTDGVKLACLQFFVCGGMGAIWMLLTDMPSLAVVWDARISIGYSGIFSCGVGYTLQIVGQKYTDPISASILMSLESVFATLFTVLFIALGVNLTGGALTVRQILGCALMFVAILLVQLPERTKVS